MPTVSQSKEHELPPEPESDDPLADLVAAEVPRPNAAHIDDPMGDYDPEGESPHW